MSSDGTGVACGRQVVPYLPLFGYALFMAWFGILGPVGARDLGQAGDLYTAVSATVDLVMLVGVASFHRSVVTLRRRKAVVRACAVLVPLASLMPLARSIPALGSQALAVPCGMASAAAQALLALMWMEAFSRLNFRRLALWFVGASALGRALTLVLRPGAGTPAMHLLLAAVGLASVVLVARVEVTDGPASEQAGVEGETALGRRWSFPTRPVVLMALYAFTDLFVRGLTSDSPSLHGAGAVAVCLAALAVAALAPRRFGVKLLYDASLPALCAAALMGLSVFSQLNPYAFVLGDIGFECFTLFTYLLLLNISFKHGISPLWLFGYARAARAAASLASNAALELPVFSQGLGTATDAALCLLVLVLVVASTVLAAGREYSTTWGMVPDAPGDGDGAQAGLSDEDRLARVARDYGLTRREEEVLACLARGDSVPQMEQALTISEGTARNHIQHVYKKLGVHSREELASRLRG